MSTPLLPQGFPSPVAPLVNPSTGQITPVWARFFDSLFVRTGSTDGANVTAIAAQGAANAANIAGVTASLNGLTGLPGIQQTATGHFWSNLGARINRITDRLFVGAAAVNDGAKTNTVKDWLSQIINWPVYNALAAFVSPNGRIAITGASRTSDLDPVDANSTQTSIGLLGIGISDATTQFLTSFGVYAEGRVYPGSTGPSFAAELEAINLTGGPIGTSTPYHELFNSSAQALRLGSGGGQGLNPAEALSAIAITQNGATFNSGIVFSAGALSGADGTSGFGYAVKLAKGHVLQWYAPGGTEGVQTGFITSVATGASGSIQFTNGGVLYVTPSGRISFSVDTTGTPTRYVSSFGTASPQAPGIRAQASDAANCNLALLPQGTGQIETSAPTQSAAVAGGGGAVPATVATFMQITVNGVTYALPLFKISA